MAATARPAPRPTRKPRTSAPALLLRANGVNFLIDTGPDLRQQALRENLRQVDAVLYTHPHADHLNGIDDLRAFCYLKRGRFAVWQPVHDGQYPRAFLRAARRWRAVGQTGAGNPRSGRPVQLLWRDSHADPGHVRPWPILGWRIGDVAYLTDVSAIPDASWFLLAGVRLLLLDCLRRTPYPRT